MEKLKICIPPDFDWRYYLISNIDVLQHGSTEEWAKRHWIEYGHREKRTYLRESFDWQWYIKIYPDLVNGGINSENTAIEHFLNYGYKESRFRNSKQIIRNFSNFNLRKILIITHSWGGGAETYLRMLIHSLNNPLNLDKNSPFYSKVHEILNNILNSDFGTKSKLLDSDFETNLKRDFENIKSKEELEILIMRSQPDGNVSLSSNDQTIYFDLNNQYDQMVNYLKDQNLSGIHVNHLIDYSLKICDLIYDLQCPYFVTLHDFYYLSGRHDSSQLNPDIDFYKLLKNSKLNIVPSGNVSNIYQQRYPNLHFNIIPNEICISYTESTSKNKLKEDSLNNDTTVNFIENNSVQGINIVNPIKIGIVGFITPHKGLHELYQLVKTCQTNKLPFEFRVIGKLESEIEGVFSTGYYSSTEELFTHMNSYDPDILWIPGKGHETFCYVLSHLLKMKKPLIVPSAPTFVERLSGFHGISFTNLDDPPESIISIIQRIMQFYPSFITQIKTLDPHFIYQSLYNHYFPNSQKMNVNDINPVPLNNLVLNDESKVFLAYRFQLMVQRATENRSNLLLEEKDLQVPEDIKFTADPLIVYHVHEYLANQLVKLRKIPINRTYNFTNKKVAVLVEPRKHALIEAVIRNIAFHLPEDWNLQVFCSSSNKTYIETLLPNWPIKYTIMPYENLNHRTYSQYLMSYNFWAQINEENVLIYQTDSFILQSVHSNPLLKSVLPNNKLMFDIQSYLDYGFVGSPHGGIYMDVDLNTPKNNGMNGGFSLRRKSYSLQAIQNTSIDKINIYRNLYQLAPLLFNIDGTVFSIEDAYYNNAMEILNIPLPPKEIKEKFCIQDIDLPKEQRQTFAIHGFHHKDYFNLEQITEIIQHAFHL